MLLHRFDLSRCKGWKDDVRRLFESYILLLQYLYGRILNVVVS